MSIQALNWAIQQRVGDASLKLLLQTLCNYANTEDQLWHTQDRISYDTEIPVRTLRRKLELLVERGFIAIEERRRDDGTKTSSLITILMQPANLADGDHRPKEGVTTGQKGGAPPATKMAGQDSKRTVKNPHTYTDRFEKEVWGPYPRQKATSKKAGFVRFSALSDSDQELVIKTIPIYARLKAGKEPDHIHHLEFYISKRIFETVSISKEATTTIENWPAQATRDQWTRVLRIYRGDSNWRLSWGPEPGKPGCYAPEDLIEEILQRP